MALIPRTLALTGGLALALTGVVASASAATTYTLLLHATRMASQAKGTAVVTQLSPADDKVTIRALALPVASTLPTTPTRHVYVAWALTGRSRQHMTIRAPISLHAASGGTYTGSGVVMMPKGARLLVTAEVSARVLRPAMPIEGVLISDMLH
jgi:hypothetical protein